MDFPVSEITYGFAFVENLTRANRGKRALPFLPTLRDEALRGYDVRLKVTGQVPYYQFKSPRILTRRNAKDCSPPSNLQPPFFRMRLMRRPHSEQHNIPVDLRSKRRNVFYTCSRLYEANSFRAIKMPKCTYNQHT